MKNDGLALDAVALQSLRGRRITALEAEETGLALEAGVAHEGSRDTHEAGEDKAEGAHGVLEEAGWDHGDAEGGVAVREIQHTDCACIPQASLALITEQYPALEVAVHASEHSSSGYVVIFTMQPTTSVLLSAHGLQVALFGLVSLLVLTSPFFGCWRVWFTAAEGVPLEA